MQSAGSTRTLPRGLPRALVLPVLLLAQAALALAVAEAGLRLCGPEVLRPRMGLDAFGRELVERRPGRLPGTLLKPNARGSIYGHEVRVNSAGFRGPEFPPTDPAETRILVLGRSVAFGWGVAEEQSWPSRLEALLEADGLRARVLNLSLPAWTLADVFGASLIHVPALKPRILLLPIHAEDFVFYDLLREALAPPAPGAGPPRRSALANLRERLEAFLGSPAGEQLLLKQAAKAIYAKAQVCLALRSAEHGGAHRPLGQGALVLAETLVRIDRFCNEHGTALVVLDMVGEGRLAQFCALQGIRYHRGRQDWSGLKRRTLIGPGDPHPNAYGHSLLAQGARGAVELALRPGPK